MHFENVRIGMKVRVLRTNTTHKVHNSNQTMRNMVGGIYTIKSMLATTKPGYRKSNPLKVKFKENNDYVWDPEDLEYAGPSTIKKKAEIFDPKNLII